MGGGAILVFKSIVALFLMAVTVEAITVNGDTLEATQPDGSKLKVRVWGDEFYRYVETVDGYTLKKDGNSWRCYAEHGKSCGTLSASSTVY